MSDGTLLYLEPVCNLITTAYCFCQYIMNFFHKILQRGVTAGFTLIELLVVISIIGLLSSVVLTSLGSARAKARDTVRKSDLNQISLALRLYYDKYDRYVSEVHGTDTSIGCDSPSVCSDQPWSTGNNWSVNSDLHYLITEGFLPRIPKDPVNNSTYFYYFEPDGVGQGTPPCTVSTCRYVLRARLEGVSGTIYYYNDNFGVGIR